MRAALMAALVAIVLPAAHRAGSEAIDIREWTVPWPDTRPRDPYVDGRGRVWFVGQVGNYIAYLDPTSGDFKRHEIHEGTNPHNLIVDTDGQVWYAGNRNATIGRLDPETGTIKVYPMPDSAARDPHTLVFDRSGHIWFTVQGGNMVGRLTKATGKVELIRVPTPRARPYGIVIDSKDRPWIVLFGSNKLATVDQTTMALREIALPREGARPRRLVVTSDDVIWYVDYADGYLGRYDPATGDVKEWPAPSGERSRPYAMEVDDRDRLWFVETGVQPNRFVVFDPASGTFVNQADVPSGAGTVRHMYYHESGQAIWFGTDVGTIGRALVR